MLRAIVWVVLLLLDESVLVKVQYQEQQSCIACIYSAVLLPSVECEQLKYLLNCGA